MSSCPAELRLEDLGRHRQVGVKKDGFMETVKEMRRAEACAYMRQSTHHHPLPCTHLSICESGNGIQKIHAQHI